jgi:hypothetical protein
MKKVVFVEMEGVLLPFAHYKPSEERAEKFASKLSEYCAENKIKLLLVSGYSYNVAERKFSQSFLKKYFNKENLICVDNKYLESKTPEDLEIYNSRIKQDEEAVDAYHKQHAILEFMKENNLVPSDIILFAEDVWLDGYYSTRFSKVDFAILEENVSEKGIPADRIQGLAYFSLDFPTARDLIKVFPKIDTSLLEKRVFDEIKKSLLGSDSFKTALAQAVQKKLLMDAEKAKKQAELQKQNESQSAFHKEFQQQEQQNIGEDKK